MPLERDIGSHQTAAGIKPDAAVQHLRYTQEKPTDFEKLEVGGVAWDLGKGMEAIFNSKNPDLAREKLENALADRIEVETGGIPSLQGGPILNYQGIKEKLAENEATGNMSIDDANRLRNLQRDLVMGAAMAVEFGRVSNRAYERALMEAVTLDREGEVPSRIDGMLGIEPLQGVGEEVSHLVVTDPRLRNTLGILNSEVTPEGKIPFEVARRAQTNLENLMMTASDLPAEEAESVVNYVRWATGEEEEEPAWAGATMGGMGGAASDMGGAVPEEFGTRPDGTPFQSYQEYMAWQQLRVQEVLEKKFLDENLMDKSDQGGVPTPWLLDIPKWMKDITGSPDAARGILELAGYWSVLVQKRRTDDNIRSSREFGRVFIGSYQIPEKLVKFVYDFDKLNVPQVWQEVACDLLEMKKIPRIDGVDGVLGDDGNKKDGFKKGHTYVFKFKDQPATEKDREGNPKTDRDGNIIYLRSDIVDPVTGEKKILREPTGSVDKFLNDSAQYKKDMAAALVTKEVCDNLEHAKVAVSMVCDWMELWGVVEQADSWRRIGYTSDYIRTVMRPEVKFVGKVGAGEKANKKPELFGGPLSDWLLAISDNKPLVALDKAKQYGFIPEQLVGSMFNDYFEVAEETDADGNVTRVTKMPLGEAVMTGKRVLFKEKEGDIGFNWKKNMMVPAATVWDHMTGAYKMEFGKVDPELAAKAWREKYYNAVKDCRENGVAVVTPQMVAGAVGASIGLWPFEPAYLWFQSKNDVDADPAFTSNYLRVVGSVARALMLSDADYQCVRETYHATKDRAAMRDYYLKVSDYKMVTNEGSPDLMRKLIQKRRGWHILK